MRRNYVSNLAFIDFLFNIVLGFAFLFFISFILINEPTKTGDIVPKAEFMIILSWDDHHSADVDLWVHGPGGTVNYVTPQQGSIFLDKDDLGTRNDIIVKDGKKVIIPINREVITIRAIEPGDYVVNAHYYSPNIGFVQNNDTNQTNTTRLTASIEVMKMNPFSIVFKSSHVMTERGEEHTFLQFSVNKEGQIYNIHETPKYLIPKYIQSTYGK